MLDIFSFLNEPSIDLFFKVAVLIVIGIYLLFTLIALTQVRALNRLVRIESGKSSFIIQNLFLLYFFLVASLFLLALVIL